MNDRKQGEWPEVDRRENAERRDPGPPTHVQVDGVSNGARTLIERAILAGENAVDEAKRTRRWIVGALTLIGLFLIAAGELRQRVENGLSNRPTDAAVLQMFAERDSALVNIIHGQQITLEIIGERQKETTRRLDLTEAELKRIRERLE